MNGVLIFIGFLFVVAVIELIGEKLRKKSNIELLVEKAEKEDMMLATTNEGVVRMSEEEFDRRSEKDC